MSKRTPAINEEYNALDSEESWQNSLIRRDINELNKIVLDCRNAYLADRISRYDIMTWSSRLCSLSKADDNIYCKLIESYPDLIDMQVDIESAINVYSYLEETASRFIYSGNEKSFNSLLSVLSRHENYSYKFKVNILNKLSIHTVQLSFIDAISKNEASLSGFRQILKQLLSDLQRGGYVPSGRDIVLPMMALNKETIHLINSPYITTCDRQTIVNKAFNHVAQYLLMHADMCCHNEVRNLLDQLYEMGVDTAHVYTFKDSLWNVILHDDMDGIRCLINYGIDPNTSGVTTGTCGAELTAIEFAQRQGKKKDTLKLLIDLGADPLMLDARGDPAIFDLIGKPCSGQMLRRYFSIDPDLLNAVNDRGTGVFETALAERDTSALNALIKLGIQDRNIRYSMWLAFGDYISIYTSNSRFVDLSELKKAHIYALESHVLNSKQSIQSLLSGALEAIGCKPSTFSKLTRILPVLTGKLSSGEFNQIVIDNQTIADHLIEYFPRTNTFEIVDFYIQQGLTMRHEQIIALQKVFEKRAPTIYKNHGEHLISLINKNGLVSAISQATGKNIACDLSL